MSGGSGSVVTDQTPCASLSMASFGALSRSTVTSFALGSRNRKVTRLSARTSGETSGGGGVGAGDGAGCARSAGAVAPRRVIMPAAIIASRPSRRLRSFIPLLVSFPFLEQSLDLLGARELDVLQRGHDRAGTGPAVLEDGIPVRRHAAAAEPPQALLRLAVRHERAALDAVRRPPLVLEAGRSRERILEQVVDDVHDPLAGLAQQLAVRAHRHLGAAFRDRDGDPDRGPLDAEQLAGDLRDDVAMVVAHVAHGGDAHAALGLQVLEGGRAVLEPFRGHAVVAQVVEHL